MARPSRHPLDDDLDLPAVEHPRQLRFPDRSLPRGDALARVQRGESSPTLKVLVALANALDVNLPALVSLGYEEHRADELRTILDARAARMTVDELRLALELIDVVLAR